METAGKGEGRSQTTVDCDRFLVFLVMGGCSVYVYCNEAYSY